MKYIRKWKGVDDRFIHYSSLLVSNVMKYICSISFSPDNRFIYSIPYFRFYDQTWKTKMRLSAADAMVLVACLRLKAAISKEG